MQITVAGVEHAGLVTCAWIEESGQMVTCIDIQKEEFIQNDLMACTTVAFPAGTNDLIQPIIERSKPPNPYLHE
jgi:hypothetical protein